MTYLKKEKSSTTQAIYRSECREPEPTYWIVNEMPECVSCGKTYEPWAAQVYGHRSNSLCCIDCFGTEEELVGFGMMHIFYGDKDPEGVMGTRAP